MDAENNDIRGLAQLIVAKHRSGAVGEVKLRFISKYAKFDNWDQGYNELQETLAEAPLKLGSKMNGGGLDNSVPFGNPFASAAPMPDIMPGPADPDIPF